MKENARIDRGEGRVIYKDKKERAREEQARQASEGLAL